jgi:hypothetical protein
MSWCNPSVAPASLVCVRLLRAISAPGLGSARPPTSAPRLGSPPQAEAREREKRNEARRKEQEAASPSHICTMNLRIPATSAPGLGPPLPHLHRDRLTPARMRWGWAHPAHICIGTGAHPPHLHRDWFTRDLHRDWAHPATSAPRPGSPPPHLHRDRDEQRRRVADYMRATKKTESSLPKTEIPLLRHEWTLAKNRFPVFLELPSVSVRRPGALPGFVRSFWGSPAVGAVLVCYDEARQRQRLLRPAVLLPAA